jgi:hypothetical protein
VVVVVVSGLEPLEGEVLELGLVDCVPELLGLVD